MVEIRVTFELHDRTYVREGPPLEDAEEVDF